MNQDYFYLKLIEFILEVKDVHGSCAVLDMLDADDIESFEKFNKIVWNYCKMAEINEDENKTIKEG